MRSRTKRMYNKEVWRVRATRALLLIPLFLSALIPAGYMPGVNGNGEYTVVICTSDGLQTVTITDPSFSGQNHNDDVPEEQTHKGLCAFSVFNVLAFVGAYETDLNGYLEKQSIWQGFSSQILDHRRAHQRPDARAPPQFLA